MRHIDMRAGWIQLTRDRGVVDFIKIDGTINPADFFTKVLSKKEFKTHYFRMMGKLPSFISRARGPADGSLIDMEDGPINPAQVVEFEAICRPLP